MQKNNLKPETHERLKNEDYGLCDSLIDVCTQKAIYFGYKNWKTLYDKQIIAIG